MKRGEAKSRLMAHIRGWSDGASVRAMRPEFTSHPTLAGVYDEGYSAGRLARSKMAEAAQVKFGVELSVLRVAIEVVE